MGRLISSTRPGHDLIKDAKISGVPTTKLADFYSKFMPKTHASYIVISDGTRGCIYDSEAFTRVESYIRIGTLFLGDCEFDINKAEFLIFA